MSYHPSDKENSTRKMLIVLAVTGAAAVVAGAFGSHSLKVLISETQLQIFQTGVTYQFYHVLAMAIVLVWQSTHPNKVLTMSFYLFFSGILLFSGSLYLLSTADITGLNLKSVIGPMTPVGGLFFIAGWLNMLRVKM
jgi:uncharacterized membrane protein YgdD (TMEM256/DUF423 family)